MSAFSFQTQRNCSNFTTEPEERLPGTMVGSGSFPVHAFQDQRIMGRSLPSTFAFPVTAAVSPILCLVTLVGSWAANLEPTVLLIIPIILCAALAIRAATQSVAPGVTWFGAAAEAAFQICSLGLSLACLSYVVAKTGLPLRDSQIAAIDAYVGFHWAAIALWIDQRPVLLGILDASYATFTTQLILVVIALLAARRYAELDRFFITFICASLLAEALSALAPTLGPAASLPPAVSLTHVHMIGRTTAEIVLALRNGSLTTIDFRALDGIICFPSLHAAVSILIPYFLRWSRPLFWPSVVLNALMLVSAIPSGNHYLADIVGGMGVAAVSIVLVNTRASWQFYHLLVGELPLVESTFSGAQLAPIFPLQRAIGHQNSRRLSGLDKSRHEAF